MPLLFVLVGAPLCYQHAKQQRQNGHTNHVVLPNAEQACRYDWGTAGLMVIVILFCRYERSTEEMLVAVLLADGPVDVSVRIWPDIHVIRYTP